MGNASHTPPPKFSRRCQWAAGQTIGYLMKQAVDNPQVLSLAAGLVDQESLPAHETRLALQKLLADDAKAREVLQYGTTAGAARLRNELLRYLARLEGCAEHNLGVDADSIVVTTGSQQLLSLLADVLLDPGDICLLGAPTYFVFMGNLDGVGARTVSVATDDDGLRIDALEAALEQIEAAGELDRVKMFYVVSYYDNPTGLSLSADRRAAIVDVARRWSKNHRIFVVEDAAYRELHYDGPALPSIWSFDSSRESVILAQTFSKSFSPGLRVGFGVLPRDLVEPVCDRKGNEDFGSAHFNQQLIATVLEEGLYAPHVATLCEAYRRKRDCMLSAAERYFRDLTGVEWVHPHGGLYVWMSLPDSVETGFHSPLFTQAAEVEKVMYVPGELFYAGEPGDSPRNQMRLSFGVQSLQGIEEGMRRLAGAVRSVL